MRVSDVLMSPLKLFGMSTVSSCIALRTWTMPWIRLTNVKYTLIYSMTNVRLKGMGWIDLGE